MRERRFFLSWGSCGKVEGERKGCGEAEEGRDRDPVHI